MSRYLVVTHQTALSPDLHRKVIALIAEDPAAEFAVLVPEAPGLTFTWELHALRWPAAEASDGAHCGPLLWHRHPGDGHSGVPTVEHAVANRTEPPSTTEVYDGGG